MYREVLRVCHCFNFREKISWSNFDCIMRDSQVNEIIKWSREGAPIPQCVRLTGYFSPFRLRCLMYKPEIIMVPTFKIFL